MPTKTESNCSTDPNTNNDNLNAKLIELAGKLNALEKTLEVRAATIDLLSNDNLRLAGISARSFECARWIVYTFCGIIVLAAGTGAVTQYYFYNIISTDHQQKLTDFRKIETTVTDAVKLVAEKQESDQKVLLQVSNTLKESLDNTQLALTTTGMVNRAIATLNIGQQRLSEQNPRAAEAYALSALREIRDSRSALAKRLPEIGSSLDVLERLGWIVLCESSIQMDKMDRFRKVVKNLVQCGCPEGARYNGLIDLHDAIRDRTETANRKELLNSSKRWFTQSLSPFQQTKDTTLDILQSDVDAGSFDYLLLSASHFSLEEYPECYDRCTAFTNSYEVGNLQLMRPRVRVNFAIATLLKRLSQASLGKSEGLEWEEICATEPGVLLPLEGRIFKFLFHDYQLRIPKAFSAKEREKITNFCSNAVNLIEYMTALPCKAGPNIDVPIDDPENRPPPPGLPEKSN